MSEIVFLSCPKSLSQISSGTSNIFRLAKNTLAFYSLKVEASKKHREVKFPRFKETPSKEYSDLERVLEVESRRTKQGLGA